MLRKLFFGAIATTLALSLGTLAQAGPVFNSVVNTDGILDAIQDNSVSQIVTSGEDPDIIEIGDVITGILRLDQRIGDSPPDVTLGANQQLIVLFSAVFTDKVDQGDGTFLFTLGALG